MTARIFPRAALAAALALPLTVFAATWATTHWRAQQGQDWLIPIQGYDPRDLLRGHYVQYRYDWPTPPVGGEGESGNLGYVSSLCLRGVAPNIASVTAYPAPNERCAITVRATFGARSEVRGLDSGILYVSQPRTVALSKQLADPQQQGFVRVKIRSDGVMRPVDLEFKPRATPR